MDKRYYGINYTDKALNHFSLPFFNRKAKESDKHKYYKREMVGKSWRYFYSKAAWDAWKNGNKPAQKKTSFFDRAKQAIARVRTNVSKQVNTAARTVQKTVGKQITNAAQTVKKTTTPFVRAAGNLVKNISEKAITKTKKVVNKVVSKFGKKSISSADVKEGAAKGEKQFKGLVAEVATKAAIRLAVGVGMALLMKGVEVLKNKFAEYKIGNRKHFKTLDEIPKQNPPQTREENQKAVNPRYKKQEGYNSNCQYCTVAYEMRCRGYDVEANGRTEGGGTDDLNNWYEPDPKFDYNMDICNEEIANAGVNEYTQKGTTTIFSAQAAALRKKMLEMPEGSRGDISVVWNPRTTNCNFGHSMHFEIQNGDVVVRCAQANKTYTLEEIMPYVTNVYYARVDNLNFETGALDCVVEKGGE